MDKRTDYLDWDTTFMGMAYLIARRSKDPKTQVGAVIVNSENIVTGLGYNGFPRGISDDEWSWGDEKHAAVIHAEANAILNSNQASLKDCRLYVPFFTCNECAKLVIQSGIREVIFCETKHYFNEKYRMKEARKMYCLAGVSSRQFSPELEICLTFGQ